MMTPASVIHARFAPYDNCRFETGGGWRAIFSSTIEKHSDGRRRFGDPSAAAAPAGGGIIEMPVFQRAAKA